MKVIFEPEPDNEFKTKLSKTINDTCAAAGIDINSPAVQVKVEMNGALPSKVLAVSNDEDLRSRVQHVIAENMSKLF